MKNLFKKKAIVNIMGGFGNQLFQYCFAYYLQKNNISVKINNFWFKQKSKFPRDEIFTPNLYGFKKSNKLNLKLYELLHRYSDNKNYISKYSDDDFSINLNGVFNEFNGYWQNSKYLRDSKEFLYNVLNKNTEISKGLKTVADHSSVLIHVRRTDYVTIGEALSEEYYIESIEAIKANVKLPKFNIFTDDLDFVKEKEVFKDINNVFCSSSNREDTILTFAEMLKNKHFIISNSTFSLMAAFLKYEDDSFITMPDPWMKKKDKDFNLLFKNCIKIKTS